MNYRRNGNMSGKPWQRKDDLAKPGNRSVRTDNTHPSNSDPSANSTPPHVEPSRTTHTHADVRASRSTISSEQETPSQERAESKLCSLETLRAAWRMVRRRGGAAGVDAITVDDFELVSERRLLEIAERLEAGTYRMSRLRPALIPKPNGSPRHLAIPTVEDRIVQQAVRLAIQDLIEPLLSPCSFAYRSGRGTQDAMDRVLLEISDGFAWIAETDVRDYFDSISHRRLMTQLGRVISSARLLDLIKQTITGRVGWWPRMRGIPQGSPLSPLLANLYLADFDRRMTDHGVRLVRYADDLVMLGESQQAVNLSLQRCRRELRVLGLSIHPDKTSLTDSRVNAFEFLGFRHEPDRLIPTVENLTRLREELAICTSSDIEQSPKERVERANSLLRSFAWYYHRCDVGRLFVQLDTEVRDAFDQLERDLGQEVPWRNRLVRMTRLRSITWGSGTPPKHEMWDAYSGRSPGSRALVGKPTSRAARGRHEFSVDD